MKIEETQVWLKSKDLVIAIYSLFTNNKDYGFKDQIQRAAVSVMNNIAEGLERKGGKELERFLYISKGSCGEVKSMLYLALEFKYINQSGFEKLVGLSTEISRMLGGFINKLNQ
jgi:four helix bundle protein